MCGSAGLSRCAAQPLESFPERLYLVCFRLGVYFLAPCPPEASRMCVFAFQIHFWKGRLSVRFFNFKQIILTVLS